jgi:hypothetical protein
MKKWILCAMVCLSGGSLWAQAYQWGVGVRGGDPSGLSVKYYVSRDYAFEFNLGQTAVWGYDARTEFYRYDRFDDYDFREGRLERAISLQVHYLRHREIPIEGSEKLAWYVGFGGQLRSTAVDYRYRVDGDNRRERVQDVDLGADGVVGLEFTFSDIPLALFADMILYAEVLDNPLLLRLQGGGGVRYNF